MKIERAAGTAENLALVTRFRRESQAWLAAHGQEQWANDWPDTETMLAGFARDLAAGETWFATEDDCVLAIITINARTNPGLWSPEETGSALFVHRLTLDRKAAGRGLGAVLLDFAGEQAQAEGRDWLRLDAWTTNKQLHAYYEGQGFRLVRVIPDHYSPSAACFERPADYRATTATSRPRRASSVEGMAT